VHVSLNKANKGESCMFRGGKEERYGKTRRWLFTRTYIIRQMEESQQILAFSLFYFFVFFFFFFDNRLPLPPAIQRNEKFTTYLRPTHVTRDSLLKGAEAEEGPARPSRDRGPDQRSSRTDQSQGTSESR
jgi:hypothetical protein